MTNDKLIQLQFALFFESIEKRPDKFISKIDDALEDLFDQMPTIVPLPDEAPPEIPRVTMQSSDGVYICNISKNRIDFVMNCIGSRNSISVILEDFINKIQPFAEGVFQSKNIIRFGFVGRYFLKESNPIKKIQLKYFKGNLGNLSELALKFNKRFEKNNLKLNDLVEISKGTVVENNMPEQEGIMINRDMNNIPTGLLRLEDMMSIIISKKDSFNLSGIQELI